MKRLLSWGAIVIACMAFYPDSAMALGSGLGIRHSPHDFTDNNGAPENNNANPAAWNNARKEICRVCHVPHDHGEVRYGNLGLLWNHQTTTRTSWTMYGQAAGQISFIQGTQDTEPSGISRMCLGCHDGVSAINQYDGKTTADPGYGNGTAYFMEDYNVGAEIGNTSASLSNNHPISITYNDVDDHGLVPANAAQMANGDKVSELLDNGKVQCSTCHDVHDTEAVAGTHLLRETTKGDDITGTHASALCLVCHDK